VPDAQCVVLPSLPRSGSGHGRSRGVWSIGRA
jgi:hypothetical protein